MVTRRLIAFGQAGLLLALLACRAPVRVDVEYLSDGDAPSDGNPPSLDIEPADPGDGPSCVDPHCDWWDSSWQYRQSLQLSSAHITETLADFPVLVSLSPATFAYEHAAEDGSDLRVVDAHGELVPFEIELWAPAGTSLLWVRSTQLSAREGQQLWLYYGNASAVSPEEPQRVWNSDYLAVYHLGEEAADEGTDATHEDSTSNGQHAQQHGNVSAAGFLGRGQQLDGSTDSVLDHIILPQGLTTGVEDFTFMAWLRWDGDRAFERIFDFNDGTDATSSSGAYAYATPRTNSEELLFSMTTAGYSSSSSVRASNLPLGVWTHVVVVRAGDTMSLFVDGARVASAEAASSTSLSSISASRHWLGRSAFVDDPLLTGILDEVRIASVARGEDWIAAQYESMTDQMVSVGIEEQRNEAIPSFE